MNFRQVEAFHAVMKLGTTTRAADILRVSQPAISRLLSQFEYTTKLHLFERVKGRLIPTPEAMILFQEIDKSFVVLDKLRSVVSDLRRYGAGSLKIASLPALGLSFLPVMIKDFLKASSSHPSVIIEIADSEQVREMVATGQFDIGFAADEVDRTGIVHEPLISTTAVCILPENHRLSEKATISAADLSGETVIGLSRTDNARVEIDAMLNQLGIQWEIAVETHFGITICQLVQQGIGIGLTNPFVLGGIHSEGVVVRPFTPAIQFKTLMIFPPDRQPSIAVNRLAMIARKGHRTYLAEIAKRYGLPGI